MRISVLTFSRDDVDTVMDLIKEMHHFVDDIVLVDSSSPQNSKEIEKRKKGLGLDKLKVFHAVALGMADPLFMYGKSKCDGDWVFLLGSDERPNDQLKRNLKKIINETKADALAVEEREGGLSTLQIRIFKKNKATFRGLVHEQANIRGKVERLPGIYYIDHMKEIGRNSWMEYEKIDRFERLTYDLFNKKISEYLFKMSTKEQQRPLSVRLLLAYEKMLGKKPGQELSNFDYFVWYFGRELTYVIKEKSISKFFMLLPREINRNGVIREWRREPDAAEIFEISKIIHKIGITKYLGLDNERTVSRLNRLYAKKRQGITLLMQLLKDRYEGRYLKT